MDKKIVKLDFTGCKEYDDFYGRIKKALNIWEGYGNNMSAVWDMLAQPRPGNFLVQVMGVHTMPKYYRKQMEILYRIFDRNRKYQAKSGYGFDYLVID